MYIFRNYWHRNYNHSGGSRRTLRGRDGEAERMKEVRLGKVRDVDLVLIKTEVQGHGALYNNLLDVVKLVLALLSRIMEPEVNSRQSSSEAVKLRNQTSLNCLCHCLVFCPGDRHTKAGNLEIFELGSGAIVKTVSAHGGQPLCGLALGQDKCGNVSGGGDK